MALLSPSQRLAALLLALGVGSCATAPHLAPRVEKDGFVLLQHRAPPGVQVSVVGDFNGWDPARDAMHPVGSDLYAATLRLSPGVYPYAFAERGADGALRIVTPEEAPAYVDDDFGGRNGVLVVSGAP